MPRRDDLKTIMVLGSGPIVIGQASEFDYSGTQAVKALKGEGYRVVLVNSNPATIMTDPEQADATYIEPLTCDMAARIIAVEKPDAILPTVGGQTGLNLAVELAEAGILEEHGVELIGASPECVRLAEDRELFKNTMARIGLDTPLSLLVTSEDMAERAMAEITFPMILRASFTLGGAGSGIAHDENEFRELLREGLNQSPVGSVLVEESVLGWKEYELEVIRDKAGNGIIVCSIENFDAMGVHTGDSVTVAPAQTLTDREFQKLRDQSLQILDAVGVVTGGSNVQFAVDPETGRIIVIEMNPRVSRSSALASKATGYPIAKVAALLAVGYTLPELPNEITGTSSACFEPSIDYTVVKVPRWAFEKFPGTPDLLGTTMQSVGEVMAIGRTFREAFQKALRSLELGLDGWESTPTGRDQAALERDLAKPRQGRLADLHEAFGRGFEPEQLHRITGIDPWFLDNLERLIETEGRLRGFTLGDGASPSCCSGPIPPRRPTPTTAPRGCEPRWSSPPVRRAVSSPYSAASTPARRSSPARRLICTRPGKKAPARADPPIDAKSSCWAAGPTASGRGSNSTPAAATPSRPCEPRASRPSSSTATPKPSARTTTFRTASTSSRCGSRRSCTSSTPNSPTA